MNPSTRLEKYQKRNRGIALIIVISIVAMLTVLTVAMLTISDNERKSSVKYAAGENASNLVDSAVSLVMKQIWDGTNQINPNSATQPYIYATQPGAVRRYKYDGTFESGYKLYSNDTMYVSSGLGEQSMATDTPALDWAIKPGEWVDLNEPVVRPSALNSGNAQYNATVFPILDPRAFVGSTTGLISNPTDNASVEGFSYKDPGFTGPAGNPNPPVVVAASFDSQTARLPMPVKWLYMLKDGTMGTMGDPQGGVYSYTPGVQGGAVPTANNPIVGRIAFWTDDECCKLNINTASEPTPWAPPSVNYDLDMQWVCAPPTRNEYQRYPGHPATVALSTVLLPRESYSDLYGFPVLSGAAFNQPSTAFAATIKARRERLYSLLPKLAGAGSNEGSTPFWTMTGTGFQSLTNNDGANNNVSVSSSLKRHLYASVDELLFAEAIGNNGQRLFQDAVPPPANYTGAATDLNLFPDSGFPVASMGPIKTGNGNSQMQPAMYLDRLRFFLTASSRAPETTMFGTPRVAMWPIADPSITSVSLFNLGTPRGGTLAEYRTAFDNSIAYCASLGKPANTGGAPPYTYFFTRADPTSSTYDAKIPRNQQLLAYLYNLMGRNYPTMVQNQQASFAPGNGGGAVAKYDNGDAQQILTEIFDYIRSTNLVDGMLAATKATLLQLGGPQNNPYDLTGLPTGAANGNSIYGQRNKLIGNDKTHTYTVDRAANTYGPGAASNDYHDWNNGQNQFLADDGMPGSGQVVPAEIPPSVFGSQSTPTAMSNPPPLNGPAQTASQNPAYRGFGRFPTVTEVGMMFICTGDGATDLGGWHAYAGGNVKQNNKLSPTVVSGGRTVAKILTSDHTHNPPVTYYVDTQGNANNSKPINQPGSNVNPDANTTVINNLSTTVPNTDTTYRPNQLISRWYSNFPPNPATNCKQKFLVNANAPANAVDGPNANYHPAWQNGNWNWSLKDDTPLADGIAAPVGFPERRVQGMICLKPTVVAAGWTGIYADFTLVVSGYDQMQLNGQPLFSHAQQLPAPYSGKGAVWRSNHSLFNGWGCRLVGASASPYNMVDNRKTIIYSGNGTPMKDNGYDSTANPNTQNYAATSNYDLVTDFITVSTAGMSMQGMMDLVNPTNIQIDIYAGNEPNFNTDKPVQTLLVPFGKTKLTIPIPQLVTISTSGTIYVNPLTGQIGTTSPAEAPYWWCLNNNGIIGGAQATAGKAMSGRFNHSATGNGSLFWGWGGGAQVMNGYGDQTGSMYDPYSNIEKVSIRGGAQGMSGVNSAFTPAGGQNRVDYFQPQAQRPYGQDVVITMVPASGDARLIAAKKIVPPTDWSIHPGYVNPTVKAAGPPTNLKLIRLIPAAQNQLQVNNTLQPTVTYPQPSYMAHSFSRYSTNTDAGFSNGENNSQNLAKDRFANGAYYDGSVMPELPDFASPPAGLTLTPYQYAQSTGDFDTGLASMRDGAWINRPDEGNTSTQYYTPNVNLSNNAPPPSYPWMTAYFESQGYHGSPAGENYMTPNRMISSAGMLGSLPTRVWGPAGGAPQPWRTLLFRPHVLYSTRTSQLMQRHPGEPVYSQQSVGSGLAKAQNPGDHYLMDLFWMPVVEPYAISEPLSTAGKINMNYQMVPFNKYIRRATGMHAVLKGELMGAFPTQDAAYYKVDETTVSGNGTVVNKVNFPGDKSNIKPYYNHKHHGDTNSALAGTDPAYTSDPLKFWYRNIVPDDGPVGAVVGTLGQFEDRFEFGGNQSGATLKPQTSAYGLFRAASQICEIHLLPKKLPASSGGNAPSATAAAANNPNSNPVKETDQDGSDPNAIQTTAGTNDYKPQDMATFWDARAITGDNVRERPYANIYAKITTKSNTFRVHYRVQTITKARSMAPNQFDPTKDSVTSEYRGSTLIERRIDPTTVTADYASTASQSNPPPALSTYYSFRVLENKRFLP